MYWRVRKISLKQIAKTYAVYAVCVVSVFLNMILLSKQSPSKALTKEQKVDFDAFARQVARHLSDSSFLTYEGSMVALGFSGLKSELGPDVLRKLQKDETVPPSLEHMKAVSRQLRETKAVSTISIDDVKIEEPNSNGLVPIEVAGRFVKHSAEGVIGPESIRFKFFVGMRGEENPLPVVAAFEDLSGQTILPQ